MKNTFWLFISISLASCYVAQVEMGKKQQRLIKQELDRLSWLTGHWQRTNSPEGRQTYENWYRQGDKDTLFHEAISIIAHSNGLAYQVTGPSLTTTSFDLTIRNDTFFSCQNLKNDFPKHIDYLYTKPNIMATIYGGDDKIDFNYTPKR